MRRLTAMLFFMALALLAAPGVSSAQGAAGPKGSVDRFVASLPPGYAAVEGSAINVDAAKLCCDMSLPLDGFQSNPYRRVQVGPNTPQEHIPDTRARWSLTARLNRYLPKLGAAVHFDGRFYNDTWGVTGGNLGLGYSQYIGKPLLLRLQVRVYQQSAATFFRDAFFYETLSTAGEYWTGDRELSPVRNATLGGKLTVITIGEDRPVWGLFEKLQLTLRGELMLIDVVAADSLAMNVAGVDRQFLYGNSLIDGARAAARPARQLLASPDPPRGRGRSRRRVSRVLPRRAPAVTPGAPRARGGAADRARSAPARARASARRARGRGAARR